MQAQRVKREKKKKKHVILIGAPVTRIKRDKSDEMANAGTTTVIQFKSWRAHCPNLCDLRIKQPTIEGEVAQELLKG